MNRLKTSLVAVMFCAIVAMGCSDGGTNPVLPDPGTDLTVESSINRGLTQTHLWGYYDVYIDIENQTVEAVSNRNAMFTANVVKFINNSTSSLGFNINDMLIGTDYIDIDINVILTHPFPGMPHYHGYDVRGVFMGDGAATLMYNDDLVYPVFGTDQFMFPDPDGGNGAPDGYTRWFNLTEFSTGGMPLFQYTQGNMAASDFAGNATLCPYKYFADGLGTNEDLWNWLNDHADQDGQFSSGATNDRNYYLRFPNDKGIMYGYAVIANWEGVEPEYHPSNAHEAVTCSVTDNSDVYYVDATTNGGNLVLDISLFGWEYQPSTIHIESTVLSTVADFDSSVITVGGGDHYSTYHVDITADAVSGIEGNEFWVIAQYGGFDYSNEFGAMNDAWDDSLAAFFRYDLEVSDTNPTTPPVCDLIINPCTLHYWNITDHVAVEFDATASYDPDGDDIIFHWDFDGDDFYDEPGDDDYTGDSDNPSHIYYGDGICNLKVVDENGAFSICTVDVDITEHQSKNIPLRGDPWIAKDLAVNPSNGDLHILYQWVEVVGSGENWWTEVDKHSPCDLYADPGEPFYVCPQGAKFYRMDVSSTGYSIIGGSHKGCSGKIFGIDPDGVKAGPHNWVIHTVDLWAFNDSDKYAFDHVTIYGWYSPPWNPLGHNTYVYRAAYMTDPPFATWIQAANIYWGSDIWYGHDKLYGNHVRGVDPVAYGNSFWVLKDSGDPSIDDSYGTLWELQSPGTYDGVYYDGAWFGTGVQGDADNTWYNAQDLTRDVNDNLLVLDQLSDGNGRIKSFTGDASGGAPVAAMNIPDDINDTPIRVDSSDYIDPLYDNLLYVLHGDSTDGYYLSIYFPDETPW